MKEIKGKIILIDSELFEKDLLELALLRKEWIIHVEHFTSTEKAFSYLLATDEEIFLIVSDMNRRDRIDGLKLKKMIDANEELSRKSIPFIFSSNSATREEVNEAYRYRIQGYFHKPLSLDESADMMDRIIQYWAIAKHPSRMR